MGLYDEGYRVAFELEVKHALQQMESLLTPCCVKGNVKGEHLYTDYLDAFTATTVTDTNAATVNTEPTFTRRRVGLSRKTIAPFLDTATDIKMGEADVLTAIRQGAISGLSRSMDDIIYTAFDADVESGKAGAGTISFDDDMTVSGTSGLTSTVVVDAKTLIEDNAVGFYGNDEYYFVCTPKQIGNLLNDDKVGSADYNTRKPLSRGRVGEYMDFTFVPVSSEIIDLVGSNRKCFAFSKRAMFWGVAQDLRVAITERADRNFTTQVFVEYFAGALRHYEGLICKVLCAE